MSARSFTLDKRRQRNITVENSKDGTTREVYLHGNLIVEHDVFEDKIYISNCGWKTPTTKTAINRYFDLIGLRGYVSQSKFVWYLTYNGNTVNLDDNGGSFTFYPNTVQLINTEINKKVNAGKILEETESTLTVRG